MVLHTHPEANQTEFSALYRFLEGRNTEETNTLTSWKIFHIQDMVITTRQFHLQLILAPDAFCNETSKKIE